LDRSRSHGRSERADAFSRAEPGEIRSVAARNATRPICRQRRRAPGECDYESRRRDYDGLQTQFSYRGNRRMFASVSYTLSKATNVEPDGNGIGAELSNIVQLHESRAWTERVDQRHRAVITF
jgi:hypothetical protein